MYYKRKSVQNFWTLFVYISVYYRRFTRLRIPQSILKAELPQGAPLLVHVFAAVFEEGYAVYSVDSLEAG